MLSSEVSTRRTTVNRPSRNSVGSTGRRERDERLGRARQEAIATSELDSAIT
jgi:Arc/MetJ family transcription regulator